MTDPQENTPEESGVFKALRLLAKTDWRSMLLVLTALTGALGFAWNKVELYLQASTAESVALDTRATKDASGGAYDVVATRLEELFFKVDALEKRLNMQTHYVPVQPDVPETLTPTTKAMAKTTKPDKPVVLEDAPMVGGGAPATTEIVGSIMGDKKPEPVSKRFERARLPDFNVIQQQAKEAELDSFISEVKGK